MTLVAASQELEGLRAPVGMWVYVSAGSNVEPARNLREAVRCLRERFGPLMVSSVYSSRAAGFAGDDFLNLVVGFTTVESAQIVVAELERLHSQAGRVRGANPFSPRTLDLDLLLYGNRVIAELQVPRPDITRYSFVLGPLAELAPGLRHPVQGGTMAALWEAFDKDSHRLQRLPISVVSTAAGDHGG